MKEAKKKDSYKSNVIFMDALFWAELRVPAKISNATRNVNHELMARPASNRRDESKRRTHAPNEPFLELKTTPRILGASEPIYRGFRSHLRWSCAARARTLWLEE